jgi:hypothetical protein
MNLFDRAVCRFYRATEALRKGDQLVKAQHPFEDLVFFGKSLCLAFAEGVQMPRHGHSDHLYISGKWTKPPIKTPNHRCLPRIDSFHAPATTLGIFTPNHLHEPHISSTAR